MVFIIGPIICLKFQVIFIFQICCQKRHQMNHHVKWRLVYFNYLYVYSKLFNSIKHVVNQPNFSLYMQYMYVKNPWIIYSQEAVFDHSVRQNVYEERQNQLRWQVKVGDNPISSQERYNILEERKKAENHYMVKQWFSQLS